MLVTDRLRFGNPAAVCTAARRVIIMDRGERVNTAAFASGDKQLARSNVGGHLTNFLTQPPQIRNR